MANDKISNMTAAAVAALTGTGAAVEVSTGIGGVPATKQGLLRDLRTAMFAGGTGYTASDPLVVGNLTASGATTVGGTLSVTDTLTLSGNLAVGATISSWGFNGNIELASTNNIAWQGSGNLLFNAYYSVSTGDYLYKTSAGSARHQVKSDGIYEWYSAPSGTAGNAVVFTKYMSLDAAGQLAVLSTTQSTSTTTGALVTAGGLGVAKDVFFGGALSVAGTSTLTGNVGIGEASSATSGLHLKLANIPTSSAGLASGDVWRNSNVLTIVP